MRVAQNWKCFRNWNLYPRSNFTKMSASKETKSNAKEEMWYGKALKEKEVRSYIWELPKGIETMKRHGVEGNTLHYLEQKQRHSSTRREQWQSKKLLGVSLSLRENTCGYTNLSINDNEAAYIMPNLNG